MIIGLCGKAGSGKDLAASYLMREFKFDATLAFADPIKDASKILFNLSDEQLNDRKLKECSDDILQKSPRQLMQWLGTDVFREQFDKDFFVNHMKTRIQKLPFRNIIISDVRFENEAAMIRQLGGIVVRIRRDNQLLIQESSHVSETTTFEVDHEVINNGVCADTFFKEIQRLKKYIDN